MRVEDDDLASPVRKFLSDEEVRRLTGALSAEQGDLLLLVADERRGRQILGRLRVELGQPARG